MKTLLKIAGFVISLALLVLAGTFLWATVKSNRILSATYDAHTVNFPIPFPLDSQERVGLTSEVAERLAREQAIERGEHLATVRYMCIECHGTELSGGVMVDAFPFGSLLGPNLTAGVGGRVDDFTPSDWDRAVRHGILPSGKPSLMPAEDFRMMSDQELSDIVMYIRSRAAVDNVVAASKYGPLGKFLIASGKLSIPINRIKDHRTPHLVHPPAHEVSIALGAHLAATCTGCHGEKLAGGRIVGGDPSWPPAKNLTPHATGIGSWTYANFETAMRDGVRPDDTPLRSPMTFVTPYTQKMTDVEIRALWAYLQSLPRVETKLQ